MTKSKKSSLSKANSKHPFVSIVIACMNERKFIASCLDSIIANNYPKTRLEVLVVDGMSKDGTREIVKSYARKYGFVELLDNPSMVTPCAFNTGIKGAKGDVIMIMGSHSVYDKDYIANCVSYMLRYKADNVGGVIKTVPRTDHPTAKAIALSLAHPFGVGNSKFRLGTDEPMWSDTVFGGCYRREVFEKIGLFNEKLIRSQDMDFNLRLKASGGKILLVPSIQSTYYARATIREFFEHNFKDGVWAIYPLKFGSSIFKLRHLLPLALLLMIIGSLLLSIPWQPALYLFIGIMSIYLFSSFYFSLKIAWRERCIRYSMILPSVFAARHFGYGLGSLWGSVKLLF